MEGPSGFCNTARQSLRLCVSRDESTEATLLGRALHVLIEYTHAKTSLHYDYCIAQDLQTTASGEPDVKVSHVFA